MEEEAKKKKSKSSSKKPIGKSAHHRRRPQTSGADFDKLQLLMQSGLSMSQAASIVNVLQGKAERGDVGSAGAKYAAAGPSSPSDDLKDLPVPHQSRLDAPDYAMAVDSTDGMFYSPTAQLYWHESSNLFFDPAQKLWFDPERQRWFRG